MRNYLLGLAAIAILISTVGCANRPLRTWLRGAPCNTCNPQFSQPTGGNFLGGCSDGSCGAVAATPPASTCNSGLCGSTPTGSGLLGGVFGNNNANGGRIFGNTASSAPPASIPASALNQIEEIAPGLTPEVYGNTNTVGRIELPPSGPFN